MNTLVYYDPGHSYSSNDSNGISRTMNTFVLSHFMETHYMVFN